jgi:hypothetical protein
LTQSGTAPVMVLSVLLTCSEQVSSYGICRLVLNKVHSLKQETGIGVEWHFLRLHMPLGGPLWGGTRLGAGHGGRASRPNAGRQAPRARKKKPGKTPKESVKSSQKYETFCESWRLCIKERHNAYDEDA